MYRPGMKAVWDGLTTLLAIIDSLFAITFVKKLRLMFSIYMGMYCWIILTSFCIGIKDMIPKYRLNRGKSFMKIPKHRHEIVFYKTPKNLIKLHRESIRTRPFTMFHLEKWLPRLPSLKKLQLTAHFLLHKLENIPCQWFYHWERTSFCWAKQTLVIRCYVFFQVFFPLIVPSSCRIDKPNMDKW